MNAAINAALQSARAVAAPLEGDDERSLLLRLELLLEREAELLESHDAEGLFAISEEREQLTVRLGEAAQARRKAMPLRTSLNDNVSGNDESELIALYQRLRHRHEIRARVMRRHGEHNARAVGVLAQASNQASLYGADGRVPVQWAGA